MNLVYLSWRFYWKILRKIISPDIPFYQNKLNNYKSGKKYPKTLSISDTLKLLINEKKSLARFGDGEFLLCYNKSIDFQEKNKILEKKLREILIIEQNHCLVGIVDIYITFNTIYSIKFWTENFFLINRLLNKKMVYANANTFRGISLSQINLLKEIWDLKDIIFVVGKKSRFVYNEDLFSNASTVDFVYTESKNAWKEYGKILSDVHQVVKLKGNPIVLLSLGPTATVIAYELSKLGIQAIDIGHITNMFLLLKGQGGKPEDLPIENK